MSANDFERCVITVPLRNVQTVPAYERAGRSMTLIRGHLAKYFEVDAENIHLDTQIDEDIWTHGRQGPPSKFYVRTARFDGGDESVVETEPTE